MARPITSVNIVATNINRRAFGEPCFGDGYNMWFRCRSNKLQLRDLAPKRGGVGVIAAQPIKISVGLVLIFFKAKLTDSTTTTTAGRNK